LEVGGVEVRAEAADPAVLEVDDAHAVALERRTARTAAPAGPLEDRDAVVRDDVAELRVHLGERGAVGLPVPLRALAAAVRLRVRRAAQLRVIREQRDHGLRVVLLFEAAQRGDERLGVWRGHVNLRIGSTERSRDRKST